MSEPLLLDTDVLIDFLREHPGAVAFLEAQEGRLLVSAVSVAELFAGVRDGKERDQLELFLHVFEILPIDRTVADRGGLFRRNYGRSHGTGIVDALIAAQAIALGARLVTLNRTHFPMIEAVLTPYTKP